jgi:NAD(P)-dependent dehydrogenase (short-subunit alcohol dehydrogenase family)
VTVATDALLDGRVAIVTGGASGIGRETALRIARHGARAVVIADLQPTPREGGTPTHEQIAAETGAQAVWVPVDVRETAQLGDAVAAAGELGGVDALVNCAGVCRNGDFLTITEAEFDRAMAINVRGTYFACQAAANAMIAHGRGGSIVNLGSAAALQGFGDFVWYCATKGAVRLMTAAMGEALGPRGIRVNAVNPGTTATTITLDDAPVIDPDRPDLAHAEVPLGRWGQPDDIADAIVFLLSDLARYVNGTSLAVDGGSSRV